MAKEPIDAPEQELETWQQVEKTFMENRNLLGGVALVVLLAIGGFFAYKSLYLKPREAQAANLIYHAQNNLQKDSVRLALYGDNVYPGFLSIADKYGPTSTGKLAHGYAAICFLKQGEFDNVIKHGKKFDSDDEWLNSRVYEVMGHAYTEKGDWSAGVKHYQMAAEESDNEITAPRNYYLAGMAAMEQENFPQANKYFTIIKEKYPRSREGQTIDKYLALTGS